MNLLADPLMMDNGEEDFLAIEPRMTRQEIAFQRIDEIDLSCVKEKLCRPTDKGGNGWTLHHVDLMEMWYKRFLKICKMQRREVVPLGDIDEFWHTHILFTRKYAKDCETVMGRFLHHVPFVGDNAEEVGAQRLREQSKALFMKYFGESPVSQEDACGCNSSGNCCGNDS